MDSSGASDGKGAVVGHIAKEYGVHVRVGAANAGHTAYVDGRKCVVQQVPVAAYANPDAFCVLGPGALISPEILLEEVQQNAAWRQEFDHRPLKLRIDPRAHVITEEHIEREQRSNLAERIGSTSTIAKEGIGAAQAARVMRDESTRPARTIDWAALREQCNLDIIDTPNQMWEANAFGEPVLLEGTQGTSLSLTTGNYPYVTSRNCTAAGLAADCGVGPRDVDRVIVVMRSYPIRVAGNSGPFYPDSEETTFDQLGVPAERTTVTKLVRRVASFSFRQAQDAVRLNSASEIALMFADYLDPRIAGLAGPVDDEILREYPAVHMLVGALDRTWCPVTMLGTSPSTMLDRLDVSRANRENEGNVQEHSTEVR